MWINDKFRLSEDKFKLPRKTKLFFAALFCSVVLIGFTAVSVEALDLKVPITVGAAAGNLGAAGTIQKATAWLAGWSAKIGLLVAFYGALETVLSFMNDDADAKVKGLKILVSGLMVYSIAHNLPNFY